MCKCPKCGQVMLGVNMESLDVDGEGRSWNGVAYSCPMCLSLLSVSIDPTAVKNDTIAEVVKEVKKMLGR